MRKILIEESTGKIISVGARSYSPQSEQIVLDLTEKIGYNSNLSKTKQEYKAKKIKVK